MPKKLILETQKDVLFLLSSRHQISECVLCCDESIFLMAFSNVKLQMCASSVRTFRYFFVWDFFVQEAHSWTRCYDKYGEGRFDAGGSMQISKCERFFRFSNFRFSKNPCRLLAEVLKSVKFHGDLEHCVSGYKKIVILAAEKRYHLMHR